jgi:hypothetical protein
VMRMPSKMDFSRLSAILIEKTPSLSLRLRVFGLRDEFILMRVWCAVDARLVCV